MENAHQLGQYYEQNDSYRYNSNEGENIKHNIEQNSTKYEK